MNPETREYIIALALFLVEHGKTMSGRELAEHLNRNKLPTGYGTSYDPDRRGIYRVFTTLHAALTAEDREKEADAVAKAFPTEDGTYAYDRLAPASEGMHLRSLAAGP